MFWAVLVLTDQKAAWLMASNGICQQFFLLRGEGIKILYQKKKRLLFSAKTCLIAILFVNKKVQVGSDVTNNFKRLMFILVKPVFNHLIWKNSWIYSVKNWRNIVPGICLSGWFFAVKSVKKKRVKNLKTPQDKFYFWPLLFGILILMYVFQFQTERKTWTIGGI